VGSRIRGVAVVAVVLVVGAFLGSALSQWWTTPLPSDASTIPFLPIADQRIRVEVLNGGERSGMAAAATDSLRDRGFDVVSFDNAPEPVDSSVVLSRAGEVAWARSVADVLGIPTVRIEPDENLYLDVSVILGSEWEPAMVPSQPEPAERGRWDPRTWFKRPGVPQNSRLADPGEPG